jgi:hypothetical protein
MKLNILIQLIIGALMLCLITASSYAILSDNFYPPGTSQLGWSLIAADSSVTGVPGPEFVGTDSFYTNVFPNPSGDSAVMRVGNFTTNANFGVATYLGGDTTQTLSLTDYQVEAWMFVAVADSTRRHQHVLFVRNPGNDRFAPQMFYNPNDAFPTIGPGIGVRSVAGGPLVLTNPGLIQDQWIWMKISVTDTVVNVYASWDGDMVDDLGLLGKGLAITNAAYTTGGFGVEVIVNDPNSGNDALINQPMYVDDVIVRLPADLIIVPSPSSINTNPGGSPVPITISGGIPDYSWSITAGIGSLSTTAGASNTYTPGTTFGTGTITITDSNSGSAEIPVALVPTSSPLFGEVSFISIDRRKMMVFELFE